MTWKNATVPSWASKSCPTQGGRAVSRYRFANCILAALVLLALAAPALAVDMDYTGQLDPFGNKPGWTAAQEQASDSQVQITAQMYYDSATGLFCFPLDSDAKLACSVADGMITNSAVLLRPDAGIAMQVYQNGKVLTGDLSTLNQPGEYVITVGSNDTRVLAFTILGNTSGAVRSYRMPEGFRIVSATKDGKPVTFQESYVDFEADGRYEVSYQCYRTEKQYTLRFTADFTAPTLALEGVTDGVARGPVDISDARQLYYKRIELDGSPMAFTSKLTRSGDYTIVVADEAGNKTTYQFTIAVYFDGNSWVFFLILLLSACAVVAYVLVSKKRLKVR